jgi:hypothetical protein
MRFLLNVSVALCTGVKIRRYLHSVMLPLAAYFQIFLPSCITVLMYINNDSRASEKYFGLIDIGQRGAKEDVQF